MAAPRRRLVRAAPPAPVRPQPDRRLAQLRARLEAERAALARWMSRLKRAFHEVERRQLRLTRLERQIAHLEE